MDSSNKLNIPKLHPSIVHLNHSGELTPERIDLLNLVAEAALKVMDENSPLLESISRNSLIRN